MTREAVIVSAARTPIARYRRGKLKDTHPVTYGAVAVREAVNESQRIKRRRN